MTLAAAASTALINIVVVCVCRACRIQYDEHGIATLLIFLLTAVMVSLCVVVL